ncbi:MAG TPA: hypothetical protein VF760_06250 [Xanthobacteraceae bacterium]
MRNRSMAALTAMLVSVGLCGGAANATMVGAPAKIVVRKSPIVCGYLGCVRTYPWAFPCQYYSLYCPYPYWPNGWYRY